jgi:hypothetical protein
MPSVKIIFYWMRAMCNYVFVQQAEKMSPLVTGMCQKSILRERGLSFEGTRNKKTHIASVHLTRELKSFQQSHSTSATCLCWPHRICKFHFSMNCQVQSYFHSTKRLPWWDSFYFSLSSIPGPSLCECVVYNGLMLDGCCLVKKRNPFSLLRLLLQMAK